MDQGTESIRKDIDATRDSMTVKMEQIEAKVRGTVDDFKGSVDDTVDSVKQVFDVNYQVQERPWAMLGGSLLVGFVVGALAGGGEEHHEHNWQPSENYRAGGSGFRDHESDYRFRPAQPSLLSNLTNQFSGEIEALKTAAMNTATNFLHDWVQENVPQFSQEFDRARREREQELARRPGPSDSAPAATYGSSAWRPNEPTSNGERKS